MSRIPGWGRRPPSDQGTSLFTNSQAQSQGVDSRSTGLRGYGERGSSATQHHRRQAKLKVEKVTDKSLQSRLIFSNLCAVSSGDFPPSADGSDLYIILHGGPLRGDYVVTAKPIPGFPKGCISLSDPQRSWCGITMLDEFYGEVYEPFSSGARAYLGSLDAEIGFASPNKRTDAPFDEDELCKIFLETYQNQVLAPGQRILMDVRNIPLLIVVKQVGLVDLAMVSDDVDRQVSRESHSRGILTKQSRVLFQRDGKGDFNLKPSMSKPNANAILAPDFKFEDMGIGGLGDEFSTIFRRAFASRIFPQRIVKDMGITPVKGLLLYGPPGTGKTLIAREIGKMLNARPPKVINGPEVLNKYVGQSEENIRKLFADAEKEYKEKGDESALHIIIFDELDAVCKQRGSGAGGGTGVGDNVVNQLLSKLDGVEQLNNVLLIGMTNRKDLIDEALMRPGRLEVHIEISLPDKPGRLEILKIHTSKMKETGRLDRDVDLEQLAGLTKNFSGAEIKGLVTTASSFAFSRHTVVGQLAAVKQDATAIRLTRADFMNALTEFRPAFGVSEAELDEAVRPWIKSYDTHFDATVEQMRRIAAMIREDPVKFSTSVLFYGPKSSGKTALAAYIAKESGFPFVKMVTPTDLVAYRDDFAKKDFVHKAFADAYKSPASILILDDFERMIGWNPIGPRFSATMLEALTTLIVSKPPNGHRLLIFVTTSKPSVLDMLDVGVDFEKKVAVPAVSNLTSLGNVLRASEKFSEHDIGVIKVAIQARIGSDSVGIGIKTILNCIFEARSDTAEDTDVLGTLAELLVEKIVSVQGSNGAI